MPNKDSIYFLINPNSGGKNAARLIRKLKEYSDGTHTHISVDELSYGHIAEHIEKAHGFHTVVVGGGDGTVSQLLQKLSSHPRVGILPLGTGNDLGREHGLLSLPHQTPQSIVDFYLTKPTQPFFLGCLEYGEHFSEKIYFSNYVSVGFDAKVIADFDALRKSRFWGKVRSVWINRLGYLYASVRNIRHGLIQRAHIGDNNLIKIHINKACRSIFFSNIRSAMGLGETNSVSSGFDKKIESLVLYNVLGYVSFLFNNSLSWLRPAFLGSAEVWQVSGMSDEVYVQYDGEPFGRFTSSEFRVTTGMKVNLIVNRGA